MFFGGGKKQGIRTYGTCRGPSMQDVARHVGRVMNLLLYRGCTRTQEVHEIPRLYPKYRSCTTLDAARRVLPCPPRSCSNNSKNKLCSRERTKVMLCCFLLLTRVLRDSLYVPASIMMVVPGQAESKAACSSVGPEYAGGGGG